MLNKQITINIIDVLVVAGAQDFKIDGNIVGTCNVLII